MVGAEQLEMRSYPVPDVEAGGAVIRVEACGLCGTDVAQFSGTFATGWPAGPLIPGHEVVGIVERGDPGTLRRWGVAVGDRVAVEPNIPCGTCRACLSGHYVSCAGWPNLPMSFGFIPTSHPPSLWGGYAEAMFLVPNAIVHRVPSGLDAGVASMFNALANGFQWACTAPNLQYGQSVLILGAGQRGLACVAAARASGAGRIIVTGLSTDGHRLEAARFLGADVVIQADKVEVPAAVREATDGEFVDVAVDCSSGATTPVIDAALSVRPGGTVVLAGLKEGRTADGFPVDRVVLDEVRLVGVRSASWQAYEQSLRLLSTDAGRFASLRTHVLGLAEAARALRILGGQIAGEHPIYVSIELAR